MIMEGEKTTNSLSSTHSIFYKNSSRETVNKPRNVSLDQKFEVKENEVSDQTSDS